MDCCLVAWTSDLDLCLRELSPITVAQDAGLQMISEDVAVNQPRVNLSSETSTSLPSPFRCAEIASSMPQLYPASYPSLPVTATPIQGCLHAITVAASMPLTCFFNPLCSVSQGEFGFFRGFYQNSALFL